MSLLSPQAPEAIALAIALAVGLIIGFERGWHGQNHGGGDDAGERSSEDRSVAGIRTFALTGLLGGILFLVGEQTHPLLLPAGALVLGGLLVASYIMTSGVTRDYGATTEVALMLTLVLGALAASGAPLEATGAAVVTAALLGFKTEIHNTLARLDRRELHSSLQLLLIALVVLPLLPNEAMGPWNSLNPRLLGLLVMLIAGIGFLGYFAMRVVGTRAGLLLTALLGGLTSSTAVSVAFARMARRSGKRQALLGAGIALACATMAPRLLVEVAAVNAALVPLILPGLAGLATVPLLAAVYVTRRHASRGEAGDIGIGNPLELTQALVIGALLAVIFVLSHAAEAWLGDRGIYALAVVSGLADVDAIALAVANQAREGLSDQVAGRAIILAALSNTVFKALFAAVIGGRELAKWVVTFLLLAVAAGAATLPFI